MIRIILICLWTLVASSSFSQIAERYKLRGSLPDNSIQVFDTYYAHTNDSFDNWSKGWGKVILVSKLKNIPDTFLIIEENYAGLALDTCLVRLVVLNGLTNPAVVLTLKTREKTNIGEGGDYTLFQTITEVWEPVGQKKLFSVISDFNYKAEYHYYFQSDSSDLDFAEYTVICNFSREVTVSKKGEIKIGIVKSNLGPKCEWDTPGNSLISINGMQLPPGRYFYRNGFYHAGK